MNSSTNTIAKPDFTDAERYVYVPQDDIDEKKKLTFAMFAIKNLDNAYVRWVPNYRSADNWLGAIQRDFDAKGHASKRFFERMRELRYGDRDSGNEESERNIKAEFYRMASSKEGIGLHISCNTERLVIFSDELNHRFNFTRDGKHYINGSAHELREDDSMQPEDLRKGVDKNAVRNSVINCISSVQKRRTLTLTMTNDETDRLLTLESILNSTLEKQARNVTNTSTVRYRKIQFLQVITMYGTLVFSKSGKKFITFLPPKDDYHNFQNHKHVLTAVAKTLNKRMNKQNRWQFSPNLSEMMVYYSYADAYTCKNAISYNQNKPRKNRTNRYNDDN